MGPIGIPEMMGIFIIALILFGPKKLPELGKLLAKGLTEFRRAKNELKSTFETHLHELEKETRLETQSYTPPVSSQSSPSYPYSYDEYGHSDMSESPAAIASTEPAVEQPAASAPAVPQTTPQSAPQTPPQTQPALSLPVPGTVPRVNGVAAGHYSAAPGEDRPV